MDDRRLIRSTIAKSGLLGLTPRMRLNTGLNPDESVFSINSARPVVSRQDEARMETCPVSVVVYDRSSRARL